MILLLAACCLLLAACCLPLAACCVLRAACCYLLHAACCLLWPISQPVLADTRNTLLAIRSRKPSPRKTLKIAKPTTAGGTENSANTRPRWTRSLPRCAATPRFQNHLCCRSTIFRAIFVTYWHLSGVSLGSFSMKLWAEPGQELSAARGLQQEGARRNRWQITPRGRRFGNSINTLHW